MVTACLAQLDHKGFDGKIIENPVVIDAAIHQMMSCAFVVDATLAWHLVSAWIGERGQTPSPYFCKNR